MANMFVMTNIGSASRITFEIPEKNWIGKISQHFPDIEFEFHSAIPVDSENMVSNDLLSLKGVNSMKCLELLKKQPDVLNIEILEQNPTKIIITIKAKSHFILYTLMKYNLVVQFPIIIKNRIIDLHVAGFLKYIDQFIEDLNQQGMDIQIRKIGKYNCSNPAHSLTPIQRDVFETAREKGYYDTPRKISLTELAKYMNKSKSTLSKIFQRIHKKLLGDQIYKVKL